MRTYRYSPNIALSVTMILAVDKSIPYVEEEGERICEVDDQVVIESENNQGLVYRVQNPEENSYALRSNGDTFGVTYSTTATWKIEINTNRCIDRVKIYQSL